MSSIAAHRSNRNRLIEASMIQGNKVEIGYANLTMTNNQVNEESFDRRDRALDLLRSNCSLAALVDANERYDAPRCAEATRRYITQKMEDWVRNDSPHHEPSSIFWLYGGAGVGKSALAQTLAEAFKTNEDLAASFFFFKADVNRNEGDRLIPTLAHELVQSFQGLTSFVEEKILQNPALFKKSRRIQMLELLIEPLIRLSLEETNGMPLNAALKLHPRLVVIDGLDECSNADTQCDLLRIIHSALPHLPYPLRFLITSRPESHIIRAFKNEFGKVARYNLSDDFDADNDIRLFLEAEFAKILCSHPLCQLLPSQWPPEADISSLVERSSGHFIYALTVIRFIQSPQHRPDDRLQVILGLKEPCEKDQPYARLDSLYSLIFLEIKDPNQLNKIHCALGIMHLRSLKSGLLALPQWTSDRHAIDALLELRPGDLVLLFDGLLSLVTFDKDNIRVFHKSLFDYLLDSSRSGDLQVHLCLAHETAANYSFRQKNSQDSWDLADFQHFAYHCQFARLNDTLVAHLKSLACDPKISFMESGLSRLPVPSTKSSVLQSVLYFLQAIGRQDFDPSGDCYRKYVEKETRCLSSAVPLSRRLKCMIMRSKLVEESTYVEKKLRFLLMRLISIVHVPQWCMDRPIGAVKTSIKQELEMFSSYVKAHHQYPAIVVSFLEPTDKVKPTPPDKRKLIPPDKDKPKPVFIHGCHFVIQATSVRFMVLVAYTKYGVRLSCSKYEGSIWLYGSSFEETLSGLVEDHLKGLGMKILTTA